MKTYLVIFCIAMIAFGISSCKSKPQITEAYMEKFINEKLPKGTSQSEVMTFLQNLKFDSRSLIGLRSGLGRFDSSSVKDSQPANVHSHITASLPDAWTDPNTIFGTSYWLRMAFYFDENEKLIGHSLYSLPDT
jgi:hypothetical protein